MGEQEGCAAQPGGIFPNGLLPNVGPLIEVLESERWLKAEERTAELVACIQPNQPSEELRNAVANYVQRLIMKCFPCQVFTFGSVPLKTYLPDGDIDLTAVSYDQNLKETWATQVRDMLVSEEKDENAEFHVKEVQYIQAEVKIIKCLVENIVVDISFNQVGGLCTLCFLEEVDRMIDRNHLFKRSIILIKAWCYYESRILGAHHGLISTYALETLVLYIFHIFNNSFTGPLEVLYRFLEFFSNFDWDNFCVSLWGPVSISSLPDVTAEPPRKDNGKLLLSKLFLDECSFQYAVFPGGQENQGQSFVSKHINVIDPLRVTNNLGRSVSKGNFYRIRSAFSFGAKKLARLLDCPKENLLLELNQFFMNTWDRHGSGVRPDAPEFPSRVSRLPYQAESDNHKESSRTKKLHDNSSGRETKVGEIRSRTASKHGSISGNTSRINGVSTQSQKNGNLNSQRISDQIIRQISSNLVPRSDKGQINLQSKHLLNDIQGRFIFARTRSSPELTDNYDEASFQDRHNRALDSVKNPATSAESNSGSNNYHRNRLKIPLPEPIVSHNGRPLSDETSSVRHDSTYHQRLDPGAGLNSGSDSYHLESNSQVRNEELSSAVSMQGMHQEEHDNMLSSSTLHGFNGHVHMPLNLPPGHLPFPVSSSILASMGYAQRNFARVLPTNFSLIDHSFSNMQFPNGLISPQLSHYFSGIGVATNSEDSIDPVNENASSIKMTVGETDHDYWQEHDTSPTGGFDSDTGNITGEKPHSPSTNFNFVPSSRLSGCELSTRGQQKHSKKMPGSVQEDCLDNFHFQENRGNEVHFDERATSSRVSSAARSSSLRSKTSSESSWEEPSTTKVSKSTREKFTAKNLPGQTEVGDLDWNCSPNMSSEMTERNSGTPSASSLHVVRHHIPSYESAQTSESEQMIPMSPIVLGPGSRQKTSDNSGVVPFAFYPTGPPVPFLTMLPVYNSPSDGASDASNHYGGEEGIRNYESGQKFDSSDRLDQSSDLNNANSLRIAASLETSDAKESDILNSDLKSHWQNLQFGRFCQNPRLQSPVTYSSPVMVPPILQGRFPWDGSGRPISGNMNAFTQLMSYGPRIVPVSPMQPVINRPPNVYQHYADDLPKYRSGTGTYLPNPKVSVRDRHQSGPRRGHYSADRSDSNVEKEGNWNLNSKTRATGRSHIRNQTDKSNSRFDRLAADENRSDRSWNSYRQDTYSSYQSQNGPLQSNSSQAGPPDGAYGMYSVPAMDPSSVSSNGPTAPSVVMLYPYDHNHSHDSHGEQLEFGTMGLGGFSGMNEQRHAVEGNRARGAFVERRFQGSSAHHPSPDQSSSPRHHRINQLKDEDFSTLAFPDQLRNGARNYDEKLKAEEEPTGFDA